MNKKILLIIFVLLLFFSVDKVDALKKCVYLDSDWTGDKIYDLDYDFFCGDNKKNKICIAATFDTEKNNKVSYLVDKNVFYENSNLRQNKITDPFNHSGYIKKDDKYGYKFVDDNNNLIYYFNVITNAVDCVDSNFDTSGDTYPIAIQPMTFNKTINKKDLNNLCFKVTSIEDKKNFIIYFVQNDDVSPVYWHVYSIEQIEDKYCNDDNSNGDIYRYERDLKNYVSCGKIGKVNKRIPEITSWVITILQVAIPILLVIIGGIDFVKAITGQKDDEIRKGQQILIKRIIVAVIIFFVVAITKILVSLVSSGDSESKSIISCIDCFISNKCS